MRDSDSITTLFDVSTACEVFCLWHSWHVMSVGLLSRTAWQRSLVTLRMVCDEKTVSYFPDWLTIFLSKPGPGCKILVMADKWMVHDQHNANISDQYRVLTRAIIISTIHIEGATPGYQSDRHRPPPPGRHHQGSLQYRSLITAYGKMKKTIKFIRFIFSIRFQFTLHLGFHVTSVKFCNRSLVLISCVSIN